MQTNVILSINNRTKVIPPTAFADEDQATHGFRPLKGKPDEAAALPEAGESGALKLALVRINDNATPFFTVGCAQSINTEPESSWVRGYLDFAFNYIEIAKDSPNYFLLFEQFNRHVLDSSFDLAVDFDFKLQAAHFEAITAVGYTACVWVTTAEFSGVDDARKAWNQSIGFLSDFLCSFEKPELPPIY